MTVILVHGTWSRGFFWTARRGTDWTVYSSELCRSLREKFGGDVTIRRLLWSGRNRHADRRAAAARLVRKIGRINHVRPNDPLVIIAHSHGGNVALYALREGVSGVHTLVTVGTPFLIANQRGLPYLAMVAAGCLVYVGLAVAVFLAITSARWREGWPWRSACCWQSSVSRAVWRTMRHETSP